MCHDGCKCGCYKPTITIYTKFWMVWSPQGPPTKKHYNMADAVAECNRLAQQNPSKVFYLMSALDVFEATGVKRTALQ